MGFLAAPQSGSSAGGASLPGSAGTVVDPIVQQNSGSQASAVVQKSSAPWGNAMPVSIGARAVIGKIIWASDIREVPAAEVAAQDGTKPQCFEVDFAVSFGLAVRPAADRPFTRMAHMWAQQVLCFDADDPSLQDSFNGMTVRFHPGLIDATPDSTVAADKGDLTPGWRGQIYAVVEKFPLWKFGLTDGLPDNIAAEIFDVASTETPVFNDYLMLTDPVVEHSGGAEFGVPDSTPLLWDASKKVFYSFLRDASSNEYVGTFDPASLTETSRIEIEGKGSTYTLLQPDILCIHDAKTQTALVEDSTGNSVPLHLIDLATGSVRASLGKTTTNVLTDIISNDNDSCELTFKKHGDMIFTQYLGGVWVGYVLGGFFDQCCTLTIQGWRIAGSSKPSALHAGDATNLGGDIGIGRPENISAMVAYPIVGRADLRRSFTNTGSGLTGGFVGSDGQPMGAIPQDAFVYCARGGRITMLRINTSFQVNNIGLGTNVDLNFAEQIDVYTIPGGQIDSLWVDPADFNLVAFWHSLDDITKTWMTKFSITCSDTVFPDQGFRPLLGAPLLQVQLPGFYDAGTHRFGIREQIGTGAIGYFSGVDNKFYEVSTSNGDTLHDTSIARSQTEGIVYNARNGVIDHMYHSHDVVERIGLRNTDPQRIPLSDIISGFMTAAGYDESEFDIDPSIDDTAWGGMLDNSGDLWDVMDNISRVYDFVYFISGDVIKFTRPTFATPGVSSNFSLKLSKLYASTSDPFDALTTVFAAPSELPGNTGVTYIDIDQNYVANTQVFRRTNFPVVVVASDNDTNLAVPIVMKADEALRRSAVATFLQFAKTNVLSFKLPVEFLQAEPGDTVDITSGNFLYHALIGETVFEDWTLSVTGFNRDVRTSNSFRIGPDGNWLSPGVPAMTPTSPVPPAKPASTSESFAVALDIPLIVPTDDTTLTFLKVYAGASAIKKDGFSGATISTQLNNDPWLTLFRTIRSTPVGAATAKLPATSTPFQTDNTTLLTINPINFDPTTFVSVSEEEFRAGHNAMVVGEDGRWELVYFRDCAVVDGLLKLSGFIRGARGTETNVNSHVNSDQIIFVTLNGERQGILGQPSAATDLGSTFRARARGDNFQGSVMETVIPALAANSLKPWAPVALKATLAEEVNDVAAPDYFNRLGGGNNLTQLADRSSLITVTSNHAPGTGTIDNLVDGAVANNGSDSVILVNGLTDLEIQFDFHNYGFKQVITAIRWEQSTGANQGTYDVEASDDAASWTTLASAVDLTNGSSLNENTFANAPDIGTTASGRSEAPPATARGATRFT
jgi:hypothetical protein